jgi:hypothetical protein
MRSRCIAAIMRHASARFEELRNLRRQVAGLTAKTPNRNASATNQLSDAPPTAAPRPSIDMFPLFYSGSIGLFGDNPVQDRVGIPAGAAGPEIVDYSGGLFRRTIVDAPQLAPAPALPLQNPRPPPSLLPGIFLRGDDRLTRLPRPTFR